MTNFLFSPGPTHVPEEILRAIYRAPVHHRSDAFREIFGRCLLRMKEIFRTEGNVALLSATGSGAMEAAVVNCLRGGERAVYVDGGKFGRRWGEICRSIGAEAIPARVKPGESLSPDRLKYVLRTYTGVKAVFLTQVESSSGALFDVRTLAQTAREHSTAAVVVDVINSLAAERFEMDNWGIDIAVAACQKALMCPPGLAMVAVSPKGVRRLIRAPGIYWNLEKYFQSARNNDPPFTPAINLCFGLDKALEMITAKGLETVYAETEWLGRAFREILNRAGLKFFPENPAAGMTAVVLPEGIIDRDVIQRLEEKTGFRIAGGQEELKGKIVRIAHMGAVGFEDLKRLIPELFTVLKELGWKGEAEGILEEFGN